MQRYILGLLVFGMNGVVQSSERGLTPLSSIDRLETIGHCKVDTVKAMYVYLQFKDKFATDKENEQYYGPIKKAALAIFNEQPACIFENQGFLTDLHRSIAHGDNEQILEKMWQDEQNMEKRTKENDLAKFQEDWIDIEVTSPSSNSSSSLSSSFSSSSLSSGLGLSNGSVSSMSTSSSSRQATIAEHRESVPSLVGAMAGSSMSSSSSSTSVLPSSSNTSDISPTPGYLGLTGPE